jgi:predicted metal-dependent hydrolase
MNIERANISVSGIPVQIERKRIANLHLGVYPPNGRVRIAVPLAVTNDAARLAVVRKLPWVKRQRAAFAKQQRQTAREMISGETHYLFGRHYRMRAVASDGPASIRIINNSVVELRIAKDATQAHRQRVIQAWYRDELTQRMAPFVTKWEAALGVKANDVRIKRMKTKWGSCTIEAGRIWLNLELAKKPEACLDYLVLHELAHLIEPNHSDKFIRLLDKHLPVWRQVRKVLNHAPLAHDEWGY